MSAGNWFQASAAMCNEGKIGMWGVHVCSENKCMED